MVSKNGQECLSKSLLNIAFLSGTPDKESQGTTINASFNLPTDDLDTKYTYKENKCSLLSPHISSESRNKHGNSKQLVERKKIKKDLKIIHNKSQTSSSREQENLRNSHCYSRTYKSPTRKQISKSVANFPPLLESPEEQGCDSHDQNDIEQTEKPRRNLLHSKLKSKSDSHLQRINKDFDPPSIIEAYHQITDCQVLIGGSTNSLTHSSGVLTCPSTSSDQYYQRRNIIESSKETLDAFIEDDKICKAGLTEIELNRFNNAKRVLDQTGLLIIKCGDKDGSTSLGYSLMVASNSTAKCIIGNISEYSACIAGGFESYIILVDNTETGGHEMNIWTTHLERNETKRRKGTMKMILVIKERNTLYWSMLLQRYEESVLDLSLPRNSLSIEEKEYLLRRCINRKKRHSKYSMVDLTDSDIHQISRSATSFEYFGLIGSFLSNVDNINQGTEFFRMPSPSLYRRIHEMKSSISESEKSMYFSLAAVYFFKGSLYKDNIAMLLRQLSTDMSQPRTSIRNSSEFLNCSSNSRRRSKSSIQTEIDVSSYNLLKQLASKLNFVSSLGKRINDGLRFLNGTFLHEDAMNSRYVFISPSIENAITLSIGQDYTQEVIATCTKEFFQNFVGTDLAYSLEEKRCIRIDIEKRSSCETAIERLRQALAEDDFEFIISHPLLRDARFLEMLSEKWNEKPLYERFLGLFWSSKRKGFAETLMNKIDKNGQSVLIYALDYPFFEGSSTEDIRSLADWVLCHKKWLEFRHENKKYAREVENKVIEHSCEEKLEDVYMNLVDHLNVGRDSFRKEWLFAAVRSGSTAIVHDILDAGNLSGEIYDQALRSALSLFVNEATSERRVILLGLSKKTATGIPSLLLSIGKSGSGRSLVALLKTLKLDINANMLTREGPMLFVLIKYNRLVLFLVLLGEHFRANLRIIHEGQLCVHKAAQFGRWRFLQHIYAIDETMAGEKNIEGKTPLHLASQNGHKNCVLILLEIGVEVNTVDRSGQTALHRAARRPDAQIVHILVKRGGPDIYVKDRERKTAIDVARQYKNEKAVSIMIGRQKKNILTDTQLNDIRCLFR